MTNLLFGFVLILFDINITLGNSIIGVLPDFVGYLFVARSLNELGRVEPAFYKMRGIALAGSIYAALMYAMDVYGMSARLGGYSVFLGFLSMVLLVLLCWSLTSCFEKLEKRCHMELGTVSMKQVVYAMAVLGVCTYATMTIMVAMSLLCMLVSMILNVVFLYQLWKVKKKMG